MSPDGTSHILRDAADLMAKGQYTRAVELLEKAIETNPVDPRLHWQLASFHAAANRLNLALGCYRETVRLDPSLASAHAGLAAVYSTVGVADWALQSSSTALALEPDNFQIRLSHAWILQSAGDKEAAWDLIRQLIDEKFVTAPSVRLFARMARFRESQNTALQLIMQLLSGTILTAREQEGLHFAAADLLDSMGRYDEAFNHAARGNSVARRPYDPAIHQKHVDRLIEFFTPERMARLARSTETSTQPVFIIGMPRSGTSLVEQILASHPDVHGAGELDFMEHVARGTQSMLRCSTDQYPECLDDLTVDQATGISQIYLQPLHALSPNAMRITDKLPLNFLHLGLINLLFPGARVIHCRRDPMDTCLSCHMNSFLAGNLFKFELTHLGLFYRQYQRLMTHWSNVLDIRILDVCYEDLVADSRMQIPRLLRFLELPEDDRCVNFHQTQRPVVTASMEQVRQPMYASSVNRWRNYEKHLEPLRKIITHGSSM